MINAEHVATTFDILRAQGFEYPGHWSSTETIAQACEVWAATLADLTPDQLRDSTLAYARSGSARWPRPGQLLEYVSPTTAGSAAIVEFRWLVNAAACCTSGLIRSGSFGDPIEYIPVEEQWDQRLEERYPGGLPLALKEAVNRIGGLPALQRIPSHTDHALARDHSFRAREFLKAVTDATAAHGNRQTITDGRALLELVGER